MSAVYVHLPWCEQKCPYCDFNSHVRETRDEQVYVDALIQDLAVDASQLQSPVHSVFFGGGTPSLFKPSSIHRIIESIDTHCDLMPDAEITLEANPGSAEQTKFKGFRGAGVNRLSIGIQSFDNHQLQKLGRIHNANQASNAVKAAQDAGFDRINIDLMHGLPEQSPAHAMEDLRQALRLGTEHLSWYQLTLEPNTAFYKQPPPLPSEDALAEIQDQGLALLRDSGLIQYEVSAFAKAGAPCRHNLNYWNYGDYLGIGAGAHGKLTLDGQVLRSQKTRLPEHYMQHYRSGAPPVFQAVETQAIPFEFMLNQLRLRQGCSEAEFAARTGLNISALEPALSKARAQGLIVADRIQTTDLGWRFLNEVIERFL